MSETVADSLSRRELVRISLMTAIAALACRRSPPILPSTETESSSGSESRPPGFGSLIPDPNGVFDLPVGFTAVVVQRAGDPMSCGNRVPSQPDGMTCHLDGAGQYVLLRNHELSDREWTSQRGPGNDIDIYVDGVSPEQAYDPTMLGGVTRVVLDPEMLDAAVLARADADPVSSNLVLTGTEFNCSGGHVPGGWVSCEETDREGHGYAFSTRIDDDDLVDPHDRRIDSWGRLKREGVTLHPDTHVVYMTEDHGQGCFYRFLPDDPTDFMGTGRLQAMALDGIVDTDPDAYREEGSEWAVHWVDVADPQASDSPCRAQAREAGAARFNRCEGSVWDGSFVWFIASTAGPTSGGQIFRYDPVAERIMLFVQVMDRSRLSMPDNLTVSPWGDLILAEDNYDNAGGATHQYLRGMTPEGEVYDLGRNPWNRPDHPGGEITGPCFSPDGRYLFVNIQTPVNLTLAITGPWRT